MYSNSKSGSITVEMAILFPLILYILFFIIYIIVLIYQQAHIQNICNETMNKVGNWWVNPEKNFSTGLNTENRISRGNIYATLYDINEGEKIAYIRKQIEYMLHHGTILKPNEFDLVKDINIKVANFILYKKLYLKVNINYRLPVPKLVDYFGIKSNYTYEVSSVALVKNYSDYISDVDFIFEIYDEYISNNKIVKGIYDAVEELKKKVLY